MKNYNGTPTKTYDACIRLNAIAELDGIGRIISRSDLHAIRNCNRSSLKQTD